MIKGLEQLALLNNIKQLTDNDNIYGEKGNILFNVKDKINETELEIRMAAFLQEVYYGKFGKTDITRGDIQLFIFNATYKQLLELQDDFFFPWTSKLADENDYETSELEEFIHNEVNSGYIATSKY